MRLMIIAHPEKEYQRLQRTVLEMPISNPDEPKERFPKELPRRLFPKSSDNNVKEQLERCILAHCHVEIQDTPEKDLSQANTQRHRVSASLGTPSHKSNPRLNSPFQEEDDDAEEEDDDEDEEPAPNRPIERERKPYAVQPGAGRVYEDNIKPILNTPVEQAKYREFATRNGRHSSAGSGNGSGGHGHKHHESQDFNNTATGGRDAEFSVKTPVSARFRDDDETRYREHTRDTRDRNDDHVRDHAHASDGATNTATHNNNHNRERERFSDQPSHRGAGGWDTDEEDYYRTPSAMSGRTGRHTPAAYDNGNQWPFR